MVNQDAALTLDGLSVSLGGRRVVHDLSLTIPSGAITALLGPNGAGKSTALKAAAGLIPCDGIVTLSGRPLIGFSAPERARRLAYVPQHSALDAPLPVIDVIAQGRFAHTGFGAPARSRTDAAAIDRALDLTDCTPLVDRLFNRLSYGERRRVLLARALATEAKVLLLDEPTAALDVGHALALLGVLRRLADAGTAVLVVLHQLQEAFDHADHVALLAQGKLVASGSPTETLDVATVSRIYGVDLITNGGFGFRLGSRT
jgi:iron complex transport system ATP-binding protein